jgi:hypothetical protein
MRVDVGDVEVSLTKEDEEEEGLPPGTGKNISAVDGMIVWLVLLRSISMWCQTY